MALDKRAPIIIPNDARTGGIEGVVSFLLDLKKEKNGARLSPNMSMIGLSIGIRRALSESHDHPSRDIRPYQSLGRCYS